jgi:hypothetical protein
MDKVRTEMLAIGIRDVKIDGPGEISSCFIEV